MPAREPPVDVDYFAGLLRSQSANGDGVVPDDEERFDALVAAADAGGLSQLSRTGGNGLAEASLVSATPSDSAATVQPSPATPPSQVPVLASEQRILDRFRADVRACGVVGEEATAATLYLLVTSRLLDKPVSAAVKGHSRPASRFTVETTVKFFPREAYIEMTAMSERALVYSKEEYPTARSCCTRRPRCAKASRTT